MSDEGILVYRLGSLGDTVIALPAFHAVRRAFPESPITLLTNKPVSAKAAAAEEVLGRGYFFDEVLDYPVGTRNPWVLAGLIWRMRRLRIRTAVNLAAFRSDRATARDRWFFRVGGVRRFVGFDLQPRDKRPVQDPLTGEVEWEAARIARRVAEWEAVDLEDAGNWDLRLTPAEVAAGEALLEPLPGHRPVLAFSTGTKVQAKYWGVENWEELSRRLAGHLPDWSAVFLGSASEREEADRCAAAWSGRVVNLCGQSTPRESAAVLKRCRLFLGHDSGPMHLAACVGVPCVAVFSARNLPRQWFPRGGARNRILQRRPDCAGCGLEVCIEQGKRCLTDIGVAEVLETALGVLFK
jgi:ADP-heptose:LPS heptosyltransferase